MKSEIRALKEVEERIEKELEDAKLGDGLGLLMAKYNLESAISQLEDYNE